MTSPLGVTWSQFSCFKDFVVDILLLHCCSMSPMWDLALFTNGTAYIWQMFNGLYFDQFGWAPQRVSKLTLAEPVVCVQASDPPGPEGGPGQGEDPWWISWCQQTTEATLPGNSCFKQSSRENPNSQWGIFMLKSSFWLSLLLILC